MADSIIIGLLLIVLALLVLPRNRGVKSNNKRLSEQRSIILDSCALIDGRVVELAKIGFLPTSIIIPNFIVKELQLLADGRDSYKRERARFGLQIVQQLQAEAGLNVVINQQTPDSDTTDEKLVVLAKNLGASLFTTDYNLNQVATIEGVQVLNINELAHALRPTALPGETAMITILQSGTNKDQGVGYMEDGTMLVVDGAVKDIGKTIKVEITKSHQTVAGKMLFAKKVATDRVTGYTSETKDPKKIVKKNLSRRRYNKSQK